MKSINFSKQVLPHIVAILVFFITTVAFFNPFFFDNMSLDQHDINQWKGGAQEMIEYREATGEEGLWTNSMFGGMPAYLISVNWDDGIISGFKSVLSLFLPHPVKNIFLGLISFYILLLSFKVRPYLAISGALAFGLSTYMIIGLGAGHNSRIGAVAFMPLVLAGVHTAFTRNKLIGVALTALALALELRENHLQITYYLLIIVVIYGAIQLFEVVKDKKIVDFSKTLALLILAALLGLGTFIGKFWTTYEYGKYSIRGKSELTQTQSSGEKTGLSRDYAFQYSNDSWGPMTMIVPNFLGGGFGTYFIQEEGSETLNALQRAGDQETANQLARYSSSFWGEKPPAPYYIGSIVCLLFVLSLFFLEKKYIIWLVSVSVLGILLSLGDSFQSFNYFMFDYFPGYNKFRSVTFTMILPFIAMPLAGFIGLEKVLSIDFTKEVQKRVFTAVGIAGGLCLAIVLFSGAASFMKPGEEQLPVWFTSALQADRESMMRSDALRSLLFIVLVGGLIYLHSKKTISSLILSSSFVILILVDNIGVDNRHFGENNYKRSTDRSFVNPTAADKEILKDKTQFRVYNLQADAMSEARTSYHHSSVGGYHGAKMRRYQDFYSNCIEGQRQQLISNLQNNNSDLRAFGAINMLNAKYLSFGPGANDYITNDAAFGNAWLIENVEKATNADEELSKTCEVNLTNTAVIDISKFNISSDVYPMFGRIRLIDSTPSRLVYDAQTSDTSLAVFSEIYYPHGWVATIDGKEEPILRANYILRALEIPKGKHEVVFEFKPAAYTIGNPITLASSIVLLLLVLGSIAYSSKELFTKSS